MVSLRLISREFQASICDKICFTAPQYAFLKRHDMVLVVMMGGFSLYNHGKGTREEPFRL
jgi:hypothetical protein